MLKILFVTIAVPYPPVNGQKLRNCALIRAMMEEGHEVTLLSFGGDHDSANHTELDKLCRAVQLVRLPLACRNTLAEYFVRLAALLSGRPQGVWRFRSSELIGRIRELISQQTFDVILCDDIYLLRNVQSDLGLPVLLNKHDLTHVILQRYLSYERNLLKRVYGQLESRWIRRWEAEASSQVDGVLICSSWDAHILRSLAPGARITVAPNVIDVSQYIPMGDGEDRTVLFFGSLEWLPNRDGLDWFTSRILPELQAVVPDVRFVVAGKDPSGQVGRRLDGVPGVEFLGTVPEIQPVIARAAVTVVPLRIGSGTRLKILEAGAMEKPIVSTHLGVEGLDFINGKEIMIEDEPCRFALAIANLLKDAEKRRQMGRAARRRVEQCYSLPVLRESIREAFARFPARASAIRRFEFSSLV